MKLIDLTLHWDPCEADEKHISLRSDKTAYTGVIYDLRFNSMSGSYIDFPGHILETDDGKHAGNTPLEEFYRVPATFLRPEREGNAITAEKLRSALGTAPPTPCLVIHGKSGTNVSLLSREIYLTMDAADWIISTGCRLLISDTYESERLDGVFLKLFSAGISTVCMPVNLDKLTSGQLKISVFTPLISGVTQVPCRIAAEIE